MEALHGSQWAASAKPTLSGFVSASAGVAPRPALSGFAPAGGGGGGGGGAGTSAGTSAGDVAAAEREKKRKSRWGDAVPEPEKHARLLSDASGFTGYIPGVKY
jgi:hypothetical protein